MQLLSAFLLGFPIFLRIAAAQPSSQDSEAWLLANPSLAARHFRERAGRRRFSSSRARSVGQNGARIESKCRFEIDHAFQIDKSLLRNLPRRARLAGPPVSALSQLFVSPMYTVLGLYLFTPSSGMPILFNSSTGLPGRSSSPSVEAIRLSSIPASSGPTTTTCKLTGGEVILLT